MPGVTKLRLFVGTRVACPSLESNPAPSPRSCTQYPPRNKTLLRAYIPGGIWTQAYGCYCIDMQQETRV